MVIQELRVPDEEPLQAMDEKLRAVFEQWRTINLTAFGYCGRTNLCPRGSYRGMCIGCPYLVPDPAQIDLALHWEALYLQQACQKSGFTASFMHCFCYPLLLLSSPWLACEEDL